MFYGPMLALLLLTSIHASVPEFADYPAKMSTSARLAAPKLRTSAERQYRTVLRQAVTRGYGVVDGGTEHERMGPNFAGHYLLVQWGCGLDCMNAALIDAKDGTILHLPDLPDNPKFSAFRLPTAGTDLRALQFRTQSSLLGIPNVRDGRTYYFVLTGRRWLPLADSPSATSAQ